MSLATATKKRQCSDEDIRVKKVSKRFEETISMDGCSFEPVIFMNVANSITVNYDCNGISCTCGKSNIKSPDEFNTNIVSIKKADYQTTDPCLIALTPSTSASKPICFQSEQTDKMYEININTACGMYCNCSAVFDKQPRTHCKHVTSFIRHLTSTFVDRIESHGCCSHMEDIIYKFTNQYVMSLMKLKSFSQTSSKSKTSPDIFKSLTDLISKISL